MTSTPNYDAWLTSRRFWTDTLERVIRTAAQVALVVFGVGTGADAAGVDLGGLESVDWQGNLAVVGLSALFTLVTCLAGKRTGDNSTASLTGGTNAQGR